MTFLRTYIQLQILSSKRVKCPNRYVYDCLDSKNDRNAIIQSHNAYLITFFEKIDRAIAQTKDYRVFLAHDPMESRFIWKIYINRSVQP